MLIECDECNKTIKIDNRDWFFHIDFAQCPECYKKYYH